MVIRKTKNTKVSAPCSWIFLPSPAKVIWLIINNLSIIARPKFYKKLFLIMAKLRQAVHYWHNIDAWRIMKLKFNKIWIEQNFFSYGKIEISFHVKYIHVLAWFIILSRCGIYRRGLRDSFYFFQFYLAQIFFYFLVLKALLFLM